MDFENHNYNQQGRVEDFYFDFSRKIMEVHGPLLRVEYLKHFPEFRIRFTYQDGWAIISDQRRGRYDIHFMSLGYFGEGPRYARHFLHAAGFRLKPEDIDNIRTGDIIENRDNNLVIVRGGKVIKEMAGPVELIVEVIQDGITYKIYKAPHDLLAKEFLACQQVTQDSFYLIVVTAKAYFGKDKNGNLENAEHIYNEFVKRLPE